MIPPHPKVPNEVSSNKVQEKCFFTQNLQVDGRVKSHFSKQDSRKARAIILKKQMTTGVYLSQVSILTLCTDLSFFVEILPRISLPSPQECSRKKSYNVVPMPGLGAIFFLPFGQPNIF